MAERIETLSWERAKPKIVHAGERWNPTVFFDIDFNAERFGELLRGQCGYSDPQISELSVIVLHRGGNRETFPPGFNLVLDATEPEAEFFNSQELREDFAAALKLTIAAGLVNFLEAVQKNGVEIFLLEEVRRGKRTMRIAGAFGGALFSFGVGMEIAGVGHAGIVFGASAVPFIKAYGGYEQMRRAMRNASLGAEGLQLDVAPWMEAVLISQNPSYKPQA